MLARLDPTDVVVFGQAGRACRAAVVAFGVPQEEEPQDGWNTSDDGVGEGPLYFRVHNFVDSVKRLAWARARGCPGDEEVCAAAADCGNLKVLRWAWENHCPWDWRVCAW